MTIELGKCAQCGNKVPSHGQCNKCGWIDSLNKIPENVDFAAAWKINEKADYKQFKSIDMHIDMEMIRLLKEGKIKQNQPQQQE
ncbi:MAG: hypothetical protein WC755_02825 [Candidatus Woesearchaeota archaeon]|jgi:hypothetical protein